MPEVREDLTKVIRDWRAIADYSGGKIRYEQSVLEAHQGMPGDGLIAPTFHVVLMARQMWGAKSPTPEPYDSAFAETVRDFAEISYRYRVSLSAYHGAYGWNVELRLIVPVPEWMTSPVGAR